MDISFAQVGHFLLDVIKHLVEGIFYYLAIHGTVSKGGDWLRKKEHDAALWYHHLHKHPAKTPDTCAEGRCAAIYADL